MLLTEHEVRRKKRIHPGFWIFLAALALTVLAFILFPYTP